MSKAIAVHLTCLLLAVALNVCAVVRQAWAQPAQAPARCLVDVEVLGDPEPALLSALKEVVGRNKLLVRDVSAQPGDVAASTTQCERFARVSVQLREDEVQVEVIDTVDGTLSTRRTLRRDPSPSIMREEVALVVRSAIDALLERSRAASTRSAPPLRPAPEPPKPEPTVSAGQHDAEPSPWSLDAGMFGFGRTFAAETMFATGFGGLVSFTAGGGAWRPTVWLTGGYQVATTTSRDGVELEARAGSFRLLPTVSLVRGPSFVLDAGVGLGVDVFAVSMSSTLPEVRTHPDRTDVVPLGSMLVAAQIPIGGGASLFLAGTGDFDFAPNRYMVVEGGTAQPLLELYPIRVGGVVGITQHLGGGEP